MIGKIDTENMKRSLPADTQAERFVTLSLRILITPLADWTDG
jgi:hypothetical protein